jgi:hypothetical protein
MNVQKRWVAYCSGNTRDATEDDWNHFVVKIFLTWRQQQLELDPNSPHKTDKALTAYADAHYNFSQFVKAADTYQELSQLELKRREP